MCKRTHGCFAWNNGVVYRAHMPVDPVKCLGQLSTLNEMLMIERNKGNKGHNNELTLRDDDDEWAPPMPINPQDNNIEGTNGKGLGCAKIFSVS